MKPNVDVLFIIVSYNTKKYLENLLGFFRGLSGSGFSYHVAVVDNGSTDGSIEMLREREDAGELSLTVTEKNLGYGSAANLGFGAADSRYVCVLNTDLNLNREAIAAVWSYLEEHPDAGVCTPVVRNADMSIQGFFSPFAPALRNPSLLKKAFMGYMKCSLARAKSPVRVDGLAGAFLFLRRSILGEEPMFDEDFFFYFEDSDLGFRLYKKGVVTMVLPGHSIVHFSGGSGAKNWQFYYRGWLLFTRKHFGQASAAKVAKTERLKALARATFYKAASYVYPTKRVLAKYGYYKSVADGIEALWKEVSNGR